jgi:hypothetical protein
MKAEMIAVVSVQYRPTIADRKHRLADPQVTADAE